MNKKSQKIALGIDYGHKWVGIAVSRGVMAFPHDVVENKGVDNLAAVIKSLMVEKDAHVVVIGDSKNHQGEDNAIMESARKLASILESEGIVIGWYNEMYTTSASMRPYTKEARSRKQIKKPGRLDASAAALILQGWLDQKSE